MDQAIHRAADALRIRYAFPVGKAGDAAQNSQPRAPKVAQRQSTTKSVPQRQPARYATLSHTVVAPRPAVRPRNAVHGLVVWQQSFTCYHHSYDCDLLPGLAFRFGRDVD
jgi:hypothetical protein